MLEFVPQMFGLVALPLLGFALTAAHRLTRLSRRVFSLAALAGGLAFVTVVWVGYFVQVAWLLSTVRAGAVTPGLELLVWQGMTGPGAHPMAPGAHGGHGAHHYHWWLLDAERGDFAAMGHLGQFLYVDPATNTVVVRQGHALGGVSSSAWLRLLRWTADHAAD